MTTDTGKGAEALLLGSLLYVPDALPDIIDRIQPQMFGILDHQRIYEAMLACYHRRQRPDIHDAPYSVRREHRPGAVLRDALFADKGVQKRRRRTPDETRQRAPEIVHYYDRSFHFT